MIAKPEGARVEREVRVREAGVADVNVLDQLVEATLDEHLADVLPPPELEAYKASNAALRPNEKCYLAETSEGIAGYAVVAANGDATRGTLKRLYVSGGATSGTIGREVAVALVTAAGSDRPSTGGSRSSEQTLTVYDRWGFVDIDAVRLCLSSPMGRRRAD
jgi:hypothetical protein